MTEKFYFDFFQVPSTGVEEPDLDAQARTDVKTVIRRPVDMKISNFGSLGIGARMSEDTTRIGLGFKDKGESEDWAKITEDTGIGQDVSLKSVSVNHNPNVAGSSIKFVRDDQFIRMGMSKNTGSSTAATQVDPPMFDVMDEKERTAAGILVTDNATIKNWPSEGWRSLGGKYDFLPYAGGTLK
jgi:hypothetical protein